VGQLPRGQGRIGGGDDGADSHEHEVEPGDGKIGTAPEVGTGGTSSGYPRRDMGNEGHGGTRPYSGCELTFLLPQSQARSTSGSKRALGSIGVRGKAGDWGGVGMGAWGLVARGGRRGPGSLPLPYWPLAFPQRLLDAEEGEGTTWTREEGRCPSVASSVGISSPNEL
jgi:hypothetical protein